MDRSELIKLLEPFQKKCAEQGKPIQDICIEEAFPGDISTSFVVQVKASWVDSTPCSTALDFLFDKLWETTSEQLRKKVFAIQVLDSNDELHCSSHQVVDKVFASS